MIKDEEKGKENADDLWWLFVRLIQMIWDKYEVPRQILWMVVVLLLKGGCDFRGIGLRGFDEQAAGKKRVLRLPARLSWRQRQRHGYGDNGGQADSSAGLHGLGPIIWHLY